MYFNENKNDTNIDKDFKDNKSDLSSFLSLIEKYKKILIIAIILIVLLILILFIFKTSSNKSVIQYLELNGEETITIYQGSDYIEPGYEAYNSKDVYLNEEVVIQSTLNNKEIGEYEITYILGNIIKTRKVNVIEKPKEYTYIHLTGNTTIYLQLGEKYNEPGYTVFSSTGLNFTDKVDIKGSVDSSKKGTYTLIYSVVDSNNVTISKSRVVIVMDADISLSLEPDTYTNGDVTINISVIDDYFDYMLLPNNNKVNENTYSYKVTDNGKYTFKVYNKKGMTKEKSIEVKNIDRTSPTGSCFGNYKDGKSNININANDNIGISKYVIDDQNYTTNQITLNSELETVSITIYDKAGNTKNISCNLEDKNEMVTSSNDIRFSYEYIQNNELSYALYTPSTASKNKTTPLIIWLHGAGEVGVSQSTFKNRGLLNVLNNWTLDGFNAYVLCPQLSNGSWNTQNIKTKVYNLIEQIIQEKNINRDKIILVGHSLGAQGIYNIADGKLNYYSALVFLSPYTQTPYDIDITQYKSIVLRGYVGTIAAGEDSNSYNHAVNVFQKTFGSDKLIVLNVGHGEIPRVAFTEDKNVDNKSDLIEWMLTQKK